MSESPTMRPTEEFKHYGVIVFDPTPLALKIAAGGLGVWAVVGMCQERETIYSYFFNNRGQVLPTQDHAPEGDNHVEMVGVVVDLSELTYNSDESISS
jgi:hypothetical protein